MSPTQLGLLLTTLAWASTQARADDLPPVPALATVEIVSTLDQQPQKVRYWVPQTPGPHAILVSLHSWSGDYTQDHSDWLREAVAREWVFIEPNFRGINDHPAACGSALARQDVIDALDWALAKGSVDDKRIYLAGVSGGGHMTMLMAAYHPQRFSAASAWVGISDLKEWHAFHTRTQIKGKYAVMLEACCGGPPGHSVGVDVEYLSRSPIHHLQHAAELPLDLNAGITDGKTGSVPIMHTLHAFNIIAQARRTPLISPAEIDQLWTHGQLTAPQDGDQSADPSYARPLSLRRTSGPSRVTLFEGGHEGLPHAACEWLGKQERGTAISR